MITRARCTNVVQGERCGGETPDPSGLCASCRRDILREQVRQVMACLSDTMLIDAYLDTLRAQGPEARQTTLFAIEVTRRQLEPATVDRAQARGASSGAARRASAPSR